MIHVIVHEFPRNMYVANTGGVLYATKSIILNSLNGSATEYNASHDKWDVDNSVHADNNRSGRPASASKTVKRLEISIPLQSITKTALTLQPQHQCLLYWNMNSI